MQAKNAYYKEFEFEMMNEFSPTKAEYSIIKTIQRGYFLQGKLIRSLVLSNIKFIFFVRSVFLKIY